ncbi:hypothetical protein SOVF_215930 [Spinacia oleracea]|nr:hypothetical protein SOVF_215930 [Spinacia oleracea]
MAATTSPMASQLKSGFTTKALVVPKGISGPALRGFPSPRRHTSFTVRAIKTEKGVFQCCNLV